jgi:hypothetical protein
MSLTVMMPNCICCGVAVFSLTVILTSGCLGIQYMQMNVSHATHQLLQVIPARVRLRLALPRLPRPPAAGPVCTP